MARYKGSYIGAATTVTPSGKGFWNIYQQGNARLEDAWPVITELQASGGSEINHSNYKYHIFYSPGNFIVASNTNPTQTIEVLVVGGGGGAGHSGPGNGGAGGGAGGIVYHTTFPIPGISPTPFSYPVQVGGGGPGGASDTVGTNGTPSFFGPPTARLTGLGGGGGGQYTVNGLPGGSGGGGGGAGAAGGSATQPGQTHPGVAPGWVNYGYAGGPSGPGNPGDGGGGGGSGGVGFAPGGGGNPGDGGPGYPFPSFPYAGIELVGVNAAVVTSPTGDQYGGGGAGEDYPDTTFIGGEGGGGGLRPLLPGNIYPGTDYTGGGGGAPINSPGGNGGDGVVIIRYQ
jgi:hypothetical protein